MLLWNELSMHIPDGFLSAPVWATLNAVSLPAVGYMARRVELREESRIPLLGVLGAFVFAAQMVNFPVAPGTSSHLLGSALLVYTVGPAAATLVMTAILAIQALLFQDGGVLALGANVFNLAVAAVAAAYIPYSLWGAGRFRRAAIFTGAALSVLTSATLALVQLRLSGVAMQPALLGFAGVWFVVAALLEGLLTVAVLQALERMNPGWIRKPARASRAVLWLAGAAFLLAGAGFVFASTSPDGLEALAGRLGIASHSVTLLHSPLADYELALFRTPWLRKASAGLAGIAVVYLLCALAARLTRRLRSA
ncbi:MAG: energy-coupling factor ABC transporter permease [Acidobacteria bacterium]|nr:energy-coupling factor ABC transporter permease [Acidobacteriota bacterium]